MIKKLLFILVPTAILTILFFQLKNKTSFESLFMKGYTTCNFYEKTKSEVISAFGYCSCNNRTDFQFEVKKEMVHDFKNFLIKKNYTELVLSIETIEKSLDMKNFDSYKNELNNYRNKLNSLNNEDRIVIENWFVNYV